MNKFESKKEQFTKPARPKIMQYIVIVLSVVLISVAIFLISNQGAEDNYFGETVADTRSYIGKLVPMTTIDPEIKDGNVVFPLEEVNTNNIVYFEIENDQNVLVPLMAYITPTGRLFVGSSMCEPCRGRKFSLAGETMVCDTCKTTYNIETHEFISGVPVCGSLPPVYMNPQVEEGNVMVDHNEILSWRIRG